jgi:hypothetical protein
MGFLAKVLAPMSGKLTPSAHYYPARATWKPDGTSKFTLLQSLMDRNQRLNVL